MNKLLPSLPEDPEGLAIGRLAEATGLPAATLRTWERRYGAPAPLRRPSGHRRYPAAEVGRLQLVRAALDAGHRAARVVGLGRRDLEELLEVRPAPPPAPRNDQDSWMARTRDLDGPGLEHALHRAAASTGLVELLEEQVAPFLRRLGEAWCRGELDVAHEHLASERLGAFLAARWRQLADRGERPAFVVGCLGDDEHVLALHAGAWVLAAAGHRVVFLGARTPLESFGRALDRARAAGVLTSRPPGMEDAALAPRLIRLRASLPAHVPLLVGGPAGGVEVSGVDWIDGFRHLESWIRRAGNP